jgi:vanillate/3-O-methylgallate O-demethylase
MSKNTNPSSSKQVAPKSLEDRLANYANPAEMLKSNPATKIAFGYLTEYMSWATEQDAWRTSAVLFDQSQHMGDARFTGPDVKKLFSDFGVNSFAKFGRNKAKQFVACNSDGKFIGDNILFGLEDDQYSLVGVSYAQNWMVFNAEQGNYRVDVEFDTRKPQDAAASRWNWRYQLNGPATYDIVAKAADGPLPEIKFFNMAEFTIAGTPVRALNHTMSGVPGEQFTGLELWGPREHGPRVLEALLAAGAPLGLRRGGERAYLSAAHESGWIPVVVSAIYTSPELLDYRKWLAPGLEAFISLEGSYDSDNVEDYYLDPWDLGYGNLVKFDHDFLGRDALAQRSAESKRQKVWLEWNVDDATRTIGDALFAEGSRPRTIDLPNVAYSAAIYDTVSLQGAQVGLSTWGGYTSNTRRIVTTGILNEDVPDGAEVELTWGQPRNGKALLLDHDQRQIRATVHHRPLTASAHA